jgi:hypothetical protein
MVFGVAAVMCLAGAAMGQDHAKPAPKPQEKMPEKMGDKGHDSNAEMEAWMESSKPGEMHKWLAQFAGTWETETTEFSPEGAGKPEKGKMEYKLTMGGRFLEMNFEGRMHGQFYHGGGAMGFNNIDQRFESTWMDTMSSNMLFMTGTADKDGKMLTLKGEFTNPMTKTKDAFKEVLTVVDKDHHKSEFFGTMNGQEMKMMEITYAREAKGTMKSDKMDKMKDKVKDKATEEMPAKKSDK